MQRDFVKYEFSYLIGDYYHSNNKLEEAIAWYEKSINNGSQDHKIYFARGACYHNLKELVKAKADFEQEIKYYDTLVKDFPQPPEERLELAACINTIERRA